MSDRVINLFSQVLGVSAGNLSNNSSPDNVAEWDSLAAMHLVAEIEETFNVEFSTKDIMKMQTIGIVKSVLIEKGVPAEDVM